MLKLLLKINLIYIKLFWWW